MGERMTDLYVYTLRAESEAELIALLEDAQEGKERPFVFDTEEGKSVDASRIVFPKPEMTAGEPAADPETGEIHTPMVPTGFWGCEVWLNEPDAELEGLSS